MNLDDELAAIVEALNAIQAEYAICGGLAVAIHGHVRATQDIDLLVPGTQVQTIEAAVKSIGYAFPALPMTFDPGTPAERVVHRSSKIVGEETMTLDLLMVGTAFETAWATRELFSWKGRRLCVVSLEGLAIMKRLAGRPQDLPDLESLGIEHD